MKSKNIILGVLGALFLIFSYLPYSYLVVALSFYFIFPSVLIFIATVYRGRHLPLYKLLGYIAVLNWLFLGCVMMFNMIVFGLLEINDANNILTYSSTLVSILVVWYLQVSLFFIKDKTVVKNSIV